MVPISYHHKMTTRLVKELPLADQGNVSCIFCTKKEDNEYLLGKFYTNRKLSVHYFCLLFASGLEQKGEEDEGILGFLDEDILKEAKRGKKLKCFKCRGMGATVGCCNTNCQRTYHLPCGKEAQMLTSTLGILPPSVPAIVPSRRFLNKRGVVSPSASSATKKLLPNRAMTSSGPPAARSIPGSIGAVSRGWLSLLATF